MIALTDWWMVLPNFVSCLKVTNIQTFSSRKWNLLGNVRKESHQSIIQSLDSIFFKIKLWWLESYRWFSYKYLGIELHCWLHDEDIWLTHLNYDHFDILYSWLNIKPNFVLLSKHQDLIVEGSRRGKKRKDFERAYEYIFYVSSKACEFSKNIIEELQHNQGGQTACPLTVLKHD